MGLAGILPVQPVANIITATILELQLQLRFPLYFFSAFTPEWELQSIFSCFVCRIYFSPKLRPQITALCTVPLQQCDNIQASCSLGLLESQEKLSLNTSAAHHSWGRGGFQWVGFG